MLYSPFHDKVTSLSTNFVLNDVTFFVCEEFDVLLFDFRNIFYEWMSKYRLDGKPRAIEDIVTM